MIDPNAFAQLMPGFDFLRNLMPGAGAAAPVAGQWIAPTLKPEEIERRIGELKTVQFWLEQNARLIGSTIQALEVQRMTLSTLQTMNLPLAELQKALTLPPADAAAPAVDAAAPKGPVDPMAWWQSLTQQFTELASKAVQDSAAIAQRAPAAAAATAKSARAAKTARKTAPRKRG